MTATNMCLNFGGFRCSFPLDLKLRYTTFIGDGDAMTFACLTEPKPYGEDVEIIIHECVGHVQKKNGTALWKLKKSGIEDENGNL